MRQAGETNLIIVDEVGSGEDYHDADITHLRLEETVLGTKMNIGASLASSNSGSSVIQKLDDDDYYAPEFLAASYDNVTRHGKGYVSGCHFFLSIIQRDPNLYHVFGQHSWFASGTMALHKSTWEETGFPNVKSGFGKHFFTNRPQIKMCYLVDPELYVLTRHGNNTWNYFEGRGNSVNNVIHGLPVYNKPLESFMAPQHAQFYQKFITEGVQS